MRAPSRSGSSPRLRSQIAASAGSLRARYLATPSAASVMVSCGRLSAHNLAPSRFCWAYISETTSEASRRVATVVMLRIQLEADSGSRRANELARRFAVSLWSFGSLICSIHLPANSAPRITTSGRISRMAWFLVFASSMPLSAKSAPSGSLRAIPSIRPITQSLTSPLSSRP